jgi:nitroreductase
MDIINPLKWRYATKKFDPTKTIPAATIEVIKQGFNLTASSYGLQPVRLLIVNNKTILKELVPISSNQQQVGQASHLFVFCIDINIDETYIRSYFEAIKSIRNTPDAVLSGFRESLISSFKSKSPDDIYNWGVKQAYLALGNMLTVCATQGIDSCPMEGFDPLAYDRYFKLNEQGMRSVLLMPIGYRAEDDIFADMKKVRKNLEDSIIEIN